MAQRDYLNYQGLTTLVAEIKTKLSAKFGKVKVGATELTPTSSDDSVEIKGTSPISVTANTSDNSVTISHTNSGATAGNYGDSSAQTPDFGDTFKVPYVGVDAKGHVTTASDHTVTLPTETESFGEVDVDGTTIASGSVGDTISFTSGTGITLTPDTQAKTIQITASNVVSGTTSYWQTHGNVISTKDVLYIYTDWKKNSDNEDIPGIKVGDGLAYISDLPFTDQLWAEHVLDSLIHVSASDRTNWDAKVRCYLDPNNAENVVFTTD